MHKSDEIEKQKYTEKKWSRKKPAKTASNKKIESQRKLAKFFYNPKQRKKKKKSSQRIERMMDKSIITE